MKTSILHFLKKLVCFSIFLTSTGLLYSQEYSPEVKRAIDSWQAVKDSDTFKNSSAESKQKIIRACFDFYKSKATSYADKNIIFNIQEQERSFVEMNRVIAETERSNKFIKDLTEGKYDNDSDKSKKETAPKKTSQDISSDANNSKLFSFGNTQFYSTKGETSLPLNLSLMIPKGWERVNGYDPRQILVIRTLDSLNTINMINLSIIKIPPAPNKNFEDIKREFLSKDFADDISRSDTAAPKVLEHKILQKESPAKVYIRGQVITNTGEIGWHENYCICTEEYFILLKYLFMYKSDNFSGDILEAGYQRKKFFEQIYNSMKIN